MIVAITFVDASEEKIIHNAENARSKTTRLAMEIPSGECVYGSS